jgi:hypothetical protein
MTIGYPHARYSTNLAVVILVDVVKELLARMARLILSAGTDVTPPVTILVDVVEE